MCLEFWPTGFAFFITNFFYLLLRKNVEKFALISCVMHNFLHEKSTLRNAPPGSFDNEKKQ